MNKKYISLFLTLLPTFTIAQTWPEVAPEAKAGTRWWWLGSAVDEANIKYNIGEYASVGIGSVEITPIYGVQNNDANEIPFLSDKWMSALRSVQSAGNKNGVLVDMTTGTGWPFGGPQVPIEEAACKVLFVIDTVAVGDEPMKSLPEKEQKYSTFQLRKRYALANGKEQVIDLYVGRTRQMVKRAAPGGEGYVIDHFDHDAVKHYLQRFDQAFSSTSTPYPHNFFNDSYEVYNANWTPTLLSEFEKRRGYKLEEHLRELLGLLDDDNQVLSDYRETLSDMLLENFSQQWTEWAHAHGALTRNQAHGSPANLIDVYASVDIPEIEGFGLSEFGINGLRTDSGHTKKNDSDVSMLKYAASAAHVTGKTLVSSETFTWLTEHFRTSLSQMKPDLDLMFTCGVNHMFFHGTAYSPRQDAWPGWKFYASVDMSPTNSIWRDAPYLMKYIERCQSFLQMGKPDNDFLVYLPVRDMWRQRLALGTKGLLMQFDIHSMARKAPDFINSIVGIDKQGFDCDYISDRLLMSVTYEDGFFRTAVGARYRALVIPGSGRMTKELKAHLDSLVDMGAPIIKDFEIDKMHRIAKAEKMRSQLGLRAIRRSNSEGYHYFISNLTQHDVNLRVPLAVPLQSALWFDPMTGNITNADVNSEGVQITLRSGESRILRTYTVDNISVKEYKPQKSTPKTIDLTNQTWTLTFENEAPAVDKKYSLPKLQTWENLDEKTRVCMGTGVYTTSFTLDKSDLNGSWSIDLGDVRESARVYINGKFVGCAWAVPYTLCCNGFLKKGKNTIKIEVTNLPANRIADLDRRGVKWRKFKEINVVDLRYKKTTYEDWPPVPSGLNSSVKLVRQ